MCLVPLFPHPPPPLYPPPPPPPCRFHDTEPQAGLPPLPPSQLSQLVVNRAKRTVPYPLLGDNTLVLSDCLCIAPDDRGRLCLFAR